MRIPVIISRRDNGAVVAAVAVMNATDRESALTQARDRIARKQPLMTVISRESGRFTFVADGRTYTATAGLPRK